MKDVLVIKFVLIGDLIWVKLLYSFIGDDYSNLNAIVWISEQIINGTIWNYGILLDI